jgi:hypothetical protein
MYVLFVTEPICKIRVILLQLYLNCITAENTYSKNAPSKLDFWSFFPYCFTDDIPVRLTRTRNWFHYTSMCRPEHLSRHSDSLWPGRSGDRIPMELDISNLCRLALELTQPPERRVPRLFPGGKATRAWRWPHTSSSKGKVKSTGHKGLEGD